MPLTHHSFDLDSLCRTIQTFARATWRRQRLWGLGQEGYGRRALIILLSAAQLFAIACSRKPVATVKTEREANEIINLLSEEDIDADKEPISGDSGEGVKEWQVYVNESFGGDERKRALRLMSDHGLPRPPLEGREKAGNSQGFLPGQDEEDKRISMMEAEIERQLLLLPGVTDAQVNIVLPKKEKISDEQPARASAVITHLDKEPRFSEEKVKDTIYGSVPNLDAGNIKVMMVYKPPQLQPRQEVAARRRTRISNALAFVLVPILAGLLAMLLFQMSRQRKQLAALRGASALSESDAGRAAEVEEADTRSLDAGAQPAESAAQAQQPNTSVKVETSA